MTAHSVWVGLRAEAETGRDRLDFAQAPPIRQPVELAIQQKIDGHSVPHAGSFKPPATGAALEKGRTWTLRLRNRREERHSVRLPIEDQGALPAGQQRYVLDLSQERRIAPGTRLELEGQEERQLRVIVGTEAYAKAKSGPIELNTFKNELRGNYPNPFEERTTLTYTLAEEREVQIEIYNVLGQRVRTLVEGKKQRAGLHRLRWEGTNRYGKPVGSGVYFYQIEAGDFRETRKMVLVR